MVTVGVTIILCVVAPVLHEYVPPLPRSVADKVIVLAPKQTEVVLGVAVMPGFSTIIGNVLVVEQPTLFVPVSTTLKLFVAAFVVYVLEA